MQQVGVSLDATPYILTSKTQTWQHGLTIKVTVACSEDVAGNKAQDDVLLCIAGLTVYLDATGASQ
jgi:hypothetical protein